MIVKWIYTNIEVRNSSLICFKHFVHLRNKVCPSLKLHSVINVINLCLELHSLINDNLDRKAMIDEVELAKWYQIYKNYIIILVCIVLRLIKNKQLFEGNTLS